MGLNTKIEWCDSTINLQMGCDGCELWAPTSGIEHCYAGVLHGRWAGRNSGWPENFDKPALFTHRLDQALSWSDMTGKKRPHKPWLDGLPRCIFANDLGDTWTESLPIDWLAPLLPRIASSRHVWMFLTKRPARALEFSRKHPLPDNFWIGTSITGPGNANRINDLLQIEASVRFLSVEPLLSLVDLRPWLGKGNDMTRSGTPYQDEIHWVIVGGESGPDARPCDIEGVRDVLEVCGSSRIPCFVKQLGASPFFTAYQIPLGQGETRFNDQKCFLSLEDGKGGDWSEWPSNLRVREMPVLRGKK